MVSVVIANMLVVNIWLSSSRGTNSEYYMDFQVGYYFTQVVSTLKTVVDDDDC